jgi:hypothetical protein
MKRTPSCLLATALLFGAIANSADASPESDARFKEAVALQKIGKLEEARQKYLQALALERAPSILLNLALLEEDANHPVEALTYLRGYLAHPQAKADKVAKLKADMLPGLVALTAHAEIRAQPGAPVTIDGKEIGNAPLKESIDLMPGKHTFGAGAQSKELNLSAGETKIVDMTPPSATVAPPPTTVTPPASSAPGPGVDIAPPPPTQPVTSRPPDDSSNTKWIVSGSLVGAGVVAAGIGIGFTAAAASAKSDLTAKQNALGPGACPNGSTAGQCGAVRTAADDVSSKNTASAVSYVIGGALIAGGIGTFLFWPSKDKSSSAWFAPYMDRAGAGGAFGASF